MDCITVSSQLQDEIRSMTKELVAPKGEPPVFNATVRMETIDGKLISEAAEGVARPDTAEPMTTSHRVHVASVAKTFTAVLVLQLAEEGRLGEQGIDTPFCAFDVFPGDIVGRLHRKAGVSHAAMISVRHLLCHISGIRDAMVDDAGHCGGPAPGSLIGLLLAAGADSARAWVPWDAQRPDDVSAGVINFFLNSGISDHPLSLPGERFHYSDTGFVLLGLLIEAIEGEPLHRVLRRRILGPLDLADSYLAYREDPALGLARQPEAEIYAGPMPFLTSGVNLSFDWAGGGLVTTMADLATFMRGLATGKLLRRRETWTEMTRWIQPEGLDATRAGVGLGLFRTDCQGIELWGHSGAWGTKMAFCPQSGLIFTGTTNQVRSKADWHHPFVGKGHEWLTRQGVPRNSAGLLAGGEPHG